MLCRIHIFLIILLFSGTAIAQQHPDSLSNIRTKRIFSHSNIIRLDTLSIIPRTVSISGLSEEDYRIDYSNGTLFLNRDVKDSLMIRYRVFPFGPEEVARRFNYDSIRFNFTMEQPLITNLPTREKLVDFGNMNYNGSFGRGISFGNNQDAVVSSTLNLQINGMIGDSLEFVAAISDNNIPIQPEGNTQNLQDFERIFMQVRKGGWQLNFGDIDVRQDKDRYLSFFKRLQGVSFLTDNRFNNGNSNSVVASGAVTKGKFNRNVLTPQEGNQGPYKLLGANGEIYFAVLAGTERVYWDGVLLQRGEDQDYVIDYNLAEVTFTARRLVTRDSRIQVEFEYSDRNFLNSMLYVSDEFRIRDRWKFNIGAYSNADAKNSSINQTLTNEQRQFLSMIGNHTEDALFPNATIDTFSVNRILYKKIDNTVNGITDSIYVHSVDRNDTLYSLSFTQVGQGAGNYVVAQGNTNGRVFEWVAPQDGHPQGEWEPALLLVTPKKHQVFSGSAEYLVSQNTRVKLSGALSDYDVNTFSAVGNHDNKGAAMRIDLDDKRPLEKRLENTLELRSHLDYEHVDRRFRSVETLRDVEFYRNWGLEIIALPADEQLINVQTGVFDQKNNFVQYQFGNYKRNNDYNGFRNAVISRYETNGWKFDNQFFLTQVNSDILKGNYFRPTVSASRKLHSLSDYEIGATYLSERNYQLLRQYDSLAPVSFAFNTWQVFLKSDESKSSRWGASYYSRQNRLPVGKNLTASDRSDNFNLNTQLMSNENRQFRLNLTYRKLHQNEQFAKNLKDDESLLGRADYVFSEFGGFITGSAFYELGAGQEQRREFTYLEVPAGQGIYMWVDYNDDGIPQLDEFEIATFEDQKRWIRVLTPTNEYIKANYIQFDYHLSIDPQRIKAKSADAFLKFVRRFSSTSSLQINKKELSQNGFSFNLFSKPLSDTSLISMSSFLSNSLYFNRSSPVWGFDLNHRVNSSKAILSYGFESNRNRDLGWRVRYNLTKTLNVSMQSNFRNRVLAVPEFANRNYDVQIMHWEPSFSYTYRTDFRATLLAGFDKKENRLNLKEASSGYALTGEVRYNVFSSGVVNARFQYNHILMQGNANTPAGYILLDGLMPGKNLLWNIELTKRIAGNIEMNLQYEGRKPAGTSMIHTGRASLRAIL